MEACLCFGLVAALDPEGVRELFDACKNYKGFLGLHVAPALRILDEQVEDEHCVALVHAGCQVTGAAVPAPHQHADVIVAKSMCALMDCLRREPEAFPNNPPQ